MCAPVLIRFGPKRKLQGSQEVHSEDLHIFLFITYHYRDEIKEDGKDRPCGIHGLDDRFVHNFYRKS